MAELMARLQRFVCGLGGHDLLLSVEPGRLRLRCMSCPYETPGWMIKETSARAEEATGRARREVRSPIVNRNAPRYV
jgi:hypothetical protein